MKDWDIFVCVCLMCEVKSGDIFVWMSDWWIEGLGYMCVYVWCVSLRLGIYVCVRMMCELKTCDIWVFISDVRIWSLRIYVCECLMCELKPGDKCVCISDIWIEACGFIFVYVLYVNLSQGIYLCVRQMCDVWMKAWVIFVWVFFVWI